METGRTTTYAALMVHVDPEHGGEAALDLAAGLARRFGAQLIGLAARAIMPPSVDPAAVGGTALRDEMIADEERRVRARMHHAAARFRARAGGVPTAWRAFIEDPTAALIRESRAADLLAIGRNEAAGTTSPDPTDLGRVLMQAGRPVLVVPPGIPTLAARQVVVAWKETREARRAVADALPFLAGADQVLVLQVCEGEGEIGAAQRAVADVVGYLARRGVRAEARARRLGEANVMGELLLAAEQRQADLIVAGCYGHTRLQEWAFGGVTRDLLTGCPKCCLLSH